MLVAILRSSAFVLAGALAVGCASPKITYAPLNTTRPQATLEQFQRDLSECATKTSPGWALLSPWVYLGLAANEGAREQACMQGRGWQGDLPPAPSPEALRSGAN